MPADNDYVKRIKIQSDILTKWWGHPIYLGATVLLAEGLREASRCEVSGRVRRRAFLARRARADSAAAGAVGAVPARRRRAAELHRLLAGRRHAADAARHAAASVALLRRFVRRELGEQRPVRRRDHEGADSRGRVEVPRDRTAVRAAAHGRIDRRMDLARAPGHVSGLLRRHVVALSGWRRLPLSPDRQRLR